MGITKYFIEKSRISITILMVLMILGGFAYFKLPQAEDPGFIIRTAVIVTYFPGAGPERIENLVTDKIEKVIQEMPEVKSINSEVRSGITATYVRIKAENKNMRPIWDSLRRKVEKVNAELPSGVIGPFVEDEFYDVFGTVLAIKGEGYSYAELKELADQTRKELLTISEVAKVQIIGTQEERVYIEYNGAKMASIGVSPYQLKTLLESRNIIIPGGEIKLGPERLSFEPSGNFNSIEDLKKTVVNVPGKQGTLYLEDLVSIKRGYVEPITSRVHASGAPALCIAVSLKKGGNIIALGKSVNEKIKNLQKQYPLGIEFETIYFQPDLVKDKVNEFVTNLIECIAIVLIVMLISLGMRTGLIVSSLIPVVILVSFIIMNFFGIGLDQVSLGALIIALGILVDNSIVVAEGTMVNLEHGKGKMESALLAVKEFWKQLLISSLAISMAFLPIFLAKSEVGEYTSSIFSVVTISLVVSWVFSITMIPMFCVWFLKENPKKTEEKYSHFVYRAYRGILLMLLRNRIKALFGVTVIFFAVMYAFNYVPAIFFPDSEAPIISTKIIMPSGTSIETTEKVVTDIEKFIEEELRVNDKRKDGIVSWGTFIGRGAPVYSLSYDPGTESPEHAYILINTTSNKVIDLMAKRLEGFVAEKYPEVEISAKRLEMGVPVGKPIAVRIMGDNNDKIMEIAASVRKKVKEINGTKNISDDWGEQTKKINIEIDQRRAMKAGITSLDVAVSMQSQLTGLDVTEYREDTKIIPVTLRSKEDGRNDIDRIKTINVYSQQTGMSISLKQIAELKVKWQPSVIYRKNGMKSITVSANIEKGITAAEINKILIPWLESEKANLGMGYKYEMGGEAESSDEGMGAIVENIPAALMIILILMVIQLNSFRKMGIIFVTIPLGLIGVVIGLLVTKSYFGFMTLLGVISLVGIVMNNAIMLIDRIKVELEENKETPQNAIIFATQRRIRPILLTKITIISGLSILWIKGGILWEPMAISIVFGILFATLLTLGVVPVLYSLLYGIKFKDYKYKE